jgi:hypothetical protein
MICFLLFINRCPSGLVIACVLDDIHIYDMFFCYFVKGALKTYHRCVCHQEHKLSLMQLGHLLINNKTYHRCVCHQEHKLSLFCYLYRGALAGLVLSCVLDDIHIYDMFFCYLLTGALVD